MFEDIFEYINILNTNKVFWGVTMIMVNLGSRYVIGDLGKFHEYLLSHDIVKKIIVFCLFFAATRDIIISFTLTILYIIVIDGMLHEKRKFCILPNKLKEKFTVNISEEEYKKALNIVHLYENKNIINDNVHNYDLYKEYKQNI